MTPNEIAKLIPEDAVERAAIADFMFWRQWHGKSDEWGDLLPEDQDGYRDAARATIAAGLAAWPKVMTERRARCDAVVLPFNFDANIGILPLQDTQDDQG